jgi:hypothetical protein
MQSNQKSTVAANLAGMNTFRTTFSIPEAGNKITHQDKLTLMGSCFAQEMGEKLKRYSFDINLNPFGILFNPISLSRALERIMENKCMQREELVHDGKMYHSLLHHGSFSRNSWQEALDHINEELEKAHDHLRNSDYLIATFGSAWAYKWKTTGEVVANCHKLPQQNFEKILLEHNAIEREWEQRITQLKAFNPKIQIIFSVSPVRYLRDGISGNQLSKSHLLIAANALCKGDACSYFPSYELLMDDLRDYRFYKEDMLHPSPLAVDYIWQVFGKTYVNTQSLELIQTMEKHIQLYEHRSIAESDKEKAERLQKAQDGIHLVLKELRNVR